MFYLLPRRGRGHVSAFTPLPAHVDSSAPAGAGRRLIYLPRVPRRASPGGAGVPAREASAVPGPSTGSAPLHPWLHPDAPPGRSEPITIPAEPSPIPMPARSAPRGPRNVATGAAQPASSRAQRNPWKRSPPLSSAPAGQRTCLRLHTFTRSCRLLRPCRGGSKIDLPSTGSASAGCAPPPLHPRLHPDAPPGRSEPITTRLSRLQSP